VPFNRLADNAVLVLTSPQVHPPQLVTLTDWSNDPLAALEPKNPV
jgi:hypothetical protein